MSPKLSAVFAAIVNIFARGSNIGICASGMTCSFDEAVDVDTVHQVFKSWFVE